MASSEEKVIQYHISRLKDKNPEVLLKTIKALVEYGEKAKDALPLLEELFKNSGDPDVKKAAQQAGRVIFLKVKEAEEQ